MYAHWDLVLNFGKSFWKMKLTPLIIPISPSQKPAKLEKIVLTADDATAADTGITYLQHSLFYIRFLLPVSVINILLQRL